jgi:acyl dehydratase
MDVLDDYRVTARNLAPDSDNKIHDDDAAQQFGFTGALVPGVEVFAYATHPFVAAWGPDFLSGGRLSIRFRRPVYDGDDVTVRPEPSGDGDGSRAFALTGSDGEPRAVGAAYAPSDQPAPDVAAYPTAAMPDPPPPASPATLPVGPLGGTIVEVAHEEGCVGYLDGIGETLALYRDDGLVHPGLLLRMVNAALFRNVALGPWIHTASDCRFLALARVGATLSARARVTDTFERNGNSYVTYDALVLADEAAVAEVHHTAIYQLAPPR